MAKKKQITKRQHTVPEGYLKNFRYPHLWRADLKAKKVEQTSVRNASMKFWYYTPEGAADQDKNAIEDMLAEEVENPAIPIFDAIIRGELDVEELSEQQRIYICTFMAFQKTRVPAFRNMVDDIVVNTYGSEIKQLTADPEEFNRVAAQYTEDTGQELSDVEEIREIVKGTEVRANPNFSLRLMLEKAPVLLRMLYRLHWKVLRSSYAYFVTTDNPVIFHDPKAPPMFRQALASPTMELTFPIANEVCLLGTWEPTEFDGSNLPPDAVHNINLRHASQVTQYVFAGTEWVAGSVLSEH